MIVSFGDSATRDVFVGQCPRRWLNIRAAASRRLALLHRAEKLEELRVPPSNRLKPLKGDRAGWYSIRINDQYRICFVWRNGHSHDVLIVDYH
jgi:toxin HigB-1